MVLSCSSLARKADGRAALCFLKSKEIRMTVYKKIGTSKNSLILGPT